MRRAALLALLLVGCHSKPESYPTVPGQVIEYKEHAAWMQMVPIYNGKTTTITYVWHPATAAIWIQTDLGMTSFPVEYGSQWRWPQGEPVRVYVKPRFMGFYRAERKNDDRW